MKTRVVALDYGSARIGVALSDEMKILASPITVFECPKQKNQTVQLLWAFLENHANQGKYAIETIVVGLPLLMNGQKGEQAEEVLKFIEALKKQTAIPIVTLDERLTTKQAESVMREANLSRKQRSVVVDKMAAVLILQSYLQRNP